MMQAAPADVDRLCESLQQYNRPFTEGHPEAAIRIVVLTPEGALLGGILAVGPVSGAAFVNYTAPYRDNRSAQVRRVRSFTTVDAGLSFESGSPFVPCLRKRARNGASPSP